MVLKPTLAEAMKILKQLQDAKQEHLTLEQNRKSFSYRQGDQDKLVPDYDYDRTTMHLNTIDHFSLELRNAVAITNLKPIENQPEFHNINDILATIAVEKQHIQRLSRLNVTEKITKRSVGFGDTATTEYTELNYDPERVQKDLRDSKKRLDKMHMLLDQLNLTTSVGELQVPTIIAHLI